MSEERPIMPPAVQAGHAEPLIIDPEHPEASPLNGVVPPVHARFKPGQSGNPSGRPKGCISIVERLKCLLHEDPDALEKAVKADGTVAGMLAQALIAHAASGKPEYMRQILERIDGKVPDSLDVTGTPSVLRIELAQATRPVEIEAEIEPEHE